MLDSVGLEHAIHPEAFTRSSKQRDKRLSECPDQEKAIAAFRGADVCRGQTKSETDVLRISEVLFNRESTCVEIDDVPRAETGIVRREAPRFLHSGCLHENDRRDLRLVGRDRSIAQHSGSTIRWNPFCCRPGFPVAVGDLDVFPEANENLKPNSSSMA